MFRRWLPLFLLLLTACGEKLPAPQAPAQETATPVTIVQPRPAPEAGWVRGSGTAAFKHEVALSFKIAGRIEGYAVDSADWVRAGQRLAWLQPTEIDAQLRAAEAAVTKATQDLERIRPLLDRGFVERARVDSAQTALAAAKAQRDAVAFNQKLATIVAPTDGVILARPLEAGQIVAAGTPALILGDRSSGLVLRLGLAERDAARVELGGRAIVSLPLGGTLSATVSRMAAKSAPGTGVIDLELTFDAPSSAQPSRLISGTIMTAAIAPRADAMAQPRLAVPATAMVEAFGDRASFYVLDEQKGRAIRRQAVVAGLRGSDILVAQGLSPHDRVIVAGAAYLRPDAKVMVTGSHPWDDHPADLSAPAPAPATEHP
jgi:RND family efflux transporter MFP subunit